MDSRIGHTVGGQIEVESWNRCPLARGRATPGWRGIDRDTHARPLMNLRSTDLIERTFTRLPAWWASGFGG